MADWREKHLPPPQHRANQSLLSPQSSPTRPSWPRPKWKRDISSTLPKKMRFYSNLNSWVCCAPHNVSKVKNFQFSKKNAARNQFMRRDGRCQGSHTSTGQSFTSWVSLLLALVLVELQNTCKKKLNREMLERPNICYIFEKLRVQRCQIWAIISSVMDTFLTVFVLQSKN